MGVYSSVWAEDYKALLKGKPKNTWIPWIKGKPGDRDVEISCVHTSYPHGLLSWGWNGEFKVVLFNTKLFVMNKSRRETLHWLILEQAKAFCVSLNETYPQGLK
jgi:hypothetical protein